MIFCRRFVERLAKNLYMINRYWTTSETLSEIEREAAMNDNSAWEIDIIYLLFI